MHSFESLSWGSLKKLSPLTVEKNSFDLVLKLLKISDSFHVTFIQLEKSFKCFFLNIHIHEILTQSTKLGKSTRSGKN